MKVWLLTKKGLTSDPQILRFKETAKEMGIECYVVNPEEFDLITTKEGQSSVRYNGEKVKLPDCLIPRRGSATNYFAHAVIRHFEHLGVLVLNSGHSINIAQDKLATSQILTLNHIPVPKTILAKSPVNLKVIESEFDYPIILKTVSGSYGKGVFLCENRSKLKDVLDLMEESKDPQVNVILQEFVKSSKGRDIRVIVIGGRVYGAMLRTAKRGYYKANYSAGANVSAFKLNKRIEWLALESTRVLNLDVAGVDILFDGKNYKVCEVNSAPGFEGFEKATGLDVPKAILEYVKFRLGEQN